MNIKQHPSWGTGKPEALKGYGERNVYSRRIDPKHLLVHGHYDDK